MSLQKMTDDELHVSTVRVAEKQREITLELLSHLNEIERRRLYSRYNSSSLHDYCVNELKMTSGTACHHMNAARLLKQMPEVKEKVLSGAIAVTTIAQAEAFFKREARSGHKFEVNEKRDLLSQLESKSTREADKILIKHSSQPEIHLKEKITQKTESLTEVRLHLDEETMESLNRLKEIWSHAMPFSSYGDLIKRALAVALEKNDPMKKAERSEVRRARLQQKAQQQTQQEIRQKAPAVGSELESGAKKLLNESEENPVPVQSACSKKISSTPALGLEESQKVGQTGTGTGTGTANGRGTAPTPALASTPALGLTPAPTKAQTRRLIWKRDQFQCTYRDPRTGERCKARHFLEEDHILPRAMGGAYTLENIRLRCRAHNQRHAIECYGESKMQMYLN
jgi:hypothetical protein